MEGIRWPATARLPGSTGRHSAFPAFSISIGQAPDIKPILMPVEIPCPQISRSCCAESTDAARPAARSVRFNRSSQTLQPTTFGDLPGLKLDRLTSLDILPFLPGSRVPTS